MQKEIIAVLTIESGSKKGQCLELASGGKLLIGRSKEADWFVADLTVSRRHAEFSADETGLYFRNYGINGSLVNGQRVEHSELIALGDDTLIEIGPCKLRASLVLLGKTIMIPKTPAAPQSLEHTQILPKKRPLEPPVAAAAPEPEEKSKPGLKTLIENLRSKYLRSGVSKISFVLVLFLGLMMLASLFSGGNAGEAKPSRQDKNSPGVEKVFRIEFPVAAISGSIPGDSIAKANELFKTAEKRLRERAVQDGNMYESIRLWQKGINLIGQYTRRDSVAIYRQALVDGQRACGEIEAELQKLQRNARVSKLAENFAQAHSIAQVMQRTAVDIDHWAYRRAKELENELKSELSTDSRKQYR